MASHRPVIVGINQYEKLQPLLYAQFDAIELKDCLVKEAGIAPQDCSLLADISPVIYQGAAFPSREIILKRLTQTAEQSAPEDTLWFFFSGYGVHWEGQDYLLPIEADPHQALETGIAVQTIFNILQRGAHRQSLVMLDMNRPLSALDSQRLGVQSMELAKQAGIPLVLACRPQQFSQDSLAVRHGLFTEAMIEGLRFHGCATLAQMGAYLTHRVPELCRHHFRPEQNPVLVTPPEQRFMLLIPAEGVGKLPGAVAPSPWPPESELSPGSPSPLPDDGPDSPTLPPLEPSLPDPDETDELGSEAELPTTKDAPGGSRWWPWSLVAIGLLLLGVLWQNQGMFWGDIALDPEDDIPEDTVPDVSDPDVPDPEPPPEADLDPLFPGTEVDPALALERARAALDQRQFAEALTWLNQIPEDQRPEDYDDLVAQAEVGVANLAVTGEAALGEARRILEPVSASLFNDAIEQARQVAVSDPDYAQAQADIQRWSQVILDLAEGRAAMGNFNGAIAAASLVPDDQAEVYPLAQTQIQRWQQRQENRQLLQQAQAILEPGQATSFQTAIALAQQIPPDYPEYATAQERIDEWSRNILAIAQARAADGEVPGAIAAASLVPPDTSAYDLAQTEIQRWQGDL
ncbi:caspase family protein [Nodosilinea sp. P-1105]|uniref:caspase family protein n=1 Tax=Nodosilinea sp. P-1105 TaxID=2546229 RepID=UPI00146BA2E9|nr:caspase family protein [Nodosilinea sp. P-1105]NMF82118.1 hypothetical protein [Nodosilinea sp. P-1105]